LSQSVEKLEVLRYTVIIPEREIKDRKIREDEGNLINLGMGETVEAYLIFSQASSPKLRSTSSSIARFTKPY
jgi:hypothetical protein